MSPRPRQVTDEAVFAGVLRAVTALGPVKMTLADVAREVGISPAALVQRFGSKRGLLLAFASQGPEGNRSIFESLRAAHRSPIAALIAMADCMAMLGSTPAEISNTLAFLQIDLTDPDFHRYALGSSQAINAGIRDLVQDAIDAGELAGCTAPRLAHALQATMNGSLLNWAVHRTGTLHAWIRRDLETVLEPYRRRRPKRPPRRRGLPPETAPSS
jgi:AcrR family transcriptional regulator